MNWITLWKAVQTRGSVTHAYRKQIITLCAPEDNWGWPEAFSCCRRKQELASSEHLGDKPGGLWSLLPGGGSHRCCNFGYFSAVVNNLSEFKRTVASGGTLEEIKIPRSNDGNCPGRQEVIDK